MMADVNRPMLNQALYLVRLYWGFTQAQMANQIGTSQSVVSEVEKGAKAVTLDLLQKYSTGLNISMSNLMFFAEEIEGEPLPRRGKLIVAEKVIKLLERIAPVDFDNAEA